jgi:hypothetical protein
MNLNIGVSVGCIIALIVAALTVNNAFNELESKIAALEKQKSEVVAFPTKAVPQKVEDATGESVNLQARAINVTAAQLACLKLVDGMIAAGENSQYQISKKMDDLDCKKVLDVARSTSAPAKPKLSL